MSAAPSFLAVFLRDGDYWVGSVDVSVLQVYRVLLCSGDIPLRGVSASPGGLMYKWALAWEDHRS